jgi:AraC-like DNA-binding protein
VCFAHSQPADIHDHLAFFRAPVRFSTGMNGLFFPATLLNEPCVRNDPSLLTVLERYAAALLDRTPRGSGLAERVRATLLQEIREGEPKASNVANRLKMSVRTLNRLLGNEGTTFRELLDHLRNELAVRHLREDTLAIAEIAFLLGFSELSAFYRAFHRWTGQSPAEFRRSLRSSNR